MSLTPDTTPVYLVQHAVQALRSPYSDEHRALVNGRLVGDIGDLRLALAELLLGVYEDWVTAHQLRRAFAGYEEPHGRAEKAAYRLALLALGLEAPPKKDVPPLEDEAA
ncbi:hypothetical protein OU415_02475 [Saccharopolyspora sp. WRP15-2]|uniref:Uncharacterized protein n=1 Tax=Saccharopolyspora oryzae TaxID=2997343 RepID=A0ABT4URD8_9PSEU|nr:hypothetical protein [Saccharopolyspora oryzae]MDA3624283.1 hypothetical protein [Saccharopolyspora oryzae]